MFITGNSIWPYHEKKLWTGLVQNTNWIPNHGICPSSQAQWIKPFPKPMCPPTANDGREGVWSNYRERSQCKPSQHAKKQKRPKEEQKREQVMQFYSPEKTSATTYNFFLSPPGNSSEWYKAPQLHPAQFLGRDSNCFITIIHKTVGLKSLLPPTRGKENQKYTSEMHMH